VEKTQTTGSLLVKHKTHKLGNVHSVLQFWCSCCVNVPLDFKFVNNETKLAV